MHMQSATHASAQSAGYHLQANERYMDFLKFALYRIIESAILFETQARNCRATTNKLFLFFLAGRRRVQHVMLEMIAMTSRPSIEDRNWLDTSAISGNHIPLADFSSDEIHSFARERAAKDLNLYISLASLEEDDETRKLLITLSKMARESLHDVAIGFSKFAPLRAQDRSAGYEISTKNEREYISMAG